jgi:hypothetical protein
MRRHQAMVDAAHVPRSQRAAALITVIILHLLLLLLFLAIRSAAPQPAQSPGALTVVSIADETEAVPPPPPKMPSKVLKEAVQLAELALSTETNPDATAASASGCVTLDTITKALLADSPTVAAVLQAPPETRSIAEAIVVWNSGWSEATATPGAPLELVRATVSQSLQSIDEACLDEPVAGPRLVPVPAGEGTMFLVFGSGSWTWRQLTLEPQPIFPTATPRPVDAPYRASLARPQKGDASF